VTSPSFRSLLLRVLARARWHRRPIAAALVAVAVLLFARELRPPSPPETLVMVAARDLGAGEDVATADVTARRLRAVDVPDRALTASPVGRVLALPVRRGEVLTDVRLLGAGLLDAVRGDGPELVAAPVHLADAATVSLLRAGDTVDVLGAGPGGATGVAARRATVLLAPSPPKSSAFGGSSSTSGGVVVLGVSSDEALALARAAATEHLSVVVRAD